MTETTPNPTTTPGRVGDLFERKPCGRCGGSGRYSYNQIHGSVCYGCGGRGTKLTKRGAAAFEAYKEALRVNVPALEVEVGQRIWFEATPGFSRARKITVTEIGPDEPNPGQDRYNIRGEDADGLVYGLGVFSTSTVRRVTTVAERRRAFESVSGLPGVVGTWPDPKEER